MDLAKGIPLDLYQKPIPNAEAVFIIKQVLSAIKYWHNNDIIHRDLKPGNRNFFLYI
jgi:serine/threonine protein kinase